MGSVTSPTGTVKRIPLTGLTDCGCYVGGSGAASGIQISLT